MKQESGVNDKISIDQVNRFTSQAMLGIYATVLISTILSLMLLGVVPSQRVVAWWSLSITVSLVRFTFQKKFLQNPATAESVGWHRNILLISLFVSGCVWGAAPLFLFPYASLPHQVLLTFVMGGMVAGSVNVFASIMASFYAFGIPAIIPLLVVIFSIRDGMHLAMGLLLSLFVLFMALANRKINLEIYNFLVLKYKNIDLINHLEKEIRDRQSAEEKLLLKNQQIESIVENRTKQLRQVNEKLRTEIEERRTMEKALREGEVKYKELANTLPQIVFETDAHGKITFANRNASELLGYSDTDFAQGLNALDILTVDPGILAHERVHAIFQGQKMDGEECTARTKGGRTFPISIHATPVVHRGRTVGMRGIIIDLTEQKRIEEAQKELHSQLQLAQKMELIGTIAGGVAHDLNNILSAIVSYPDLLLMRLPPDSALKKPLLIMQESGIRAAAIVQDLLTLTRRGVVVEEVLNMNAIISAYLESPEHAKLMSAHRRVRIETLLEGELLNIAGSEVHLSKTLTNLVSNAAEAMPQGGVIQISTTNCYLDQPVKRYAAIAEGDYVVLTVSDNGTGIAAHDLDRIFEPFFTKKVMGRSGTGLGMAVVWGTVKDHKGYIDVASIENHGSQFSLYFPVTRLQKAQVDHPEPIEAYHGKGESILLVDDVEVQRQVASDLLTHLGYRVTTAKSGEEAIDLLRNQSVDLIILDMIMAPGRDGLDTFREIITLHPQQRAVIASGFSETDRVKQALALGAGPYIKKPYTWIKLGQAVKMALGTRTDAA